MTDWINAAERRPTEADADAQNCVVVWHRYNGVMVTGICNVGTSPFISHWLRPPAAPEGEQPAREEAFNERYGTKIL